MLRSRWEDNITIHLKEIGINMRNWIDSTQDIDYWRTLVNAELGLRVLLVTRFSNLKNVITRKQFFGKMKA